MTPVAILVLAAGASSRMQGRDKLTEPIDGTPLLARVVARTMATGHPVWVTLPGLDHPRRALIGAATPVLVPDAADGMAHSIRAGVAAIPADAAILLLPGDMPGIKSDHILSLINAFQADPDVAIWQGETDTGLPGHPVLFPPDCRAGLMALSGDSGALPVLRANAHRVRRVTLPGDAARLDLDTPQAWAEYLAKRGQQG